VQQLCHALFLVTTKYRIVRNIQSVQNSSFGGGRRQFARASLLLFLAFVAGFIKVLCCPRVLECARAFVCLFLCLCACLPVASCCSFDFCPSVSASFHLPFRPCRLLSLPRPLSMWHFVTPCFGFALLCGYLPGKFLETPKYLIRSHQSKIYI